MIRLIDAYPTDTEMDDGLTEHDATKTDPVGNNRSVRPTGGIVLLWCVAIALIIVLLICAVIAALNFDVLGWVAATFIGGLAGIVLLALCVLYFIQKGRRFTDRRASDRGSIYSHAFFENSEPSLIMRDEKPLHANQAYFELARNLGVEHVGTAPPAIDRLFTTTSDDVASAIFRLYHTSDDTQNAEEFLDHLTPDEGVKRFKISISRLGRERGYKLWQVTEVAASNAAGDGLMAHAPIGLFSISRDGDLLAMNTTLSRWLGLKGETPPTHIRDIVEKPDLLLGSLIEEGRTVKADTRLLTRKGVVTPTVMAGQWAKVDSGELVCNVALYGHSSLTQSMAQRHLPKSVSQSSDATEAQIAGMASAPVGLLELSVADLSLPLTEARIESVNPAFERMAAGTSLLEKSFSNAFAVDDNAHDVEHRFLELTPEQCDPNKPFDAVLVGETNVPVSVYVLVDEASLNPMSDVDASKKIWVFLVDVSARKSLEDQLVQSQKMQAIGQLAAGVAHDFNNLLTAIRLNTDELLQRHPVGDPSYPELQNINSTGARAAALVKKLLAFSRKQTRRMEVLSVTDTLSDMVVTLRQTLGEKAKLIMVHGRNLPPVMADKSQIDTVLMNLCVNARDAMAEQGGGTITVKSGQLRREDVKEPALSEALLNISGDDFVTIEVSDTGTGMSEEIMSKIFEPFFTTKEQGKGTGLGLATVYGIVQQSGGHLDVKSELGKGTTFRITLPVADSDRVMASKEAQKPEPVAEARKPANLAGQGTILFVEDEASVRVIAAKTMRKRGYTVVEAEDGEEALEILEDGDYDFDMMISDVVMPGMDGPTLLKEGRHLLGDARIVFISGYAEEQFSDLLSEEPDVTFLPKPFTLAQLAEKVKAEIGEAN